VAAIAHEGIGGRPATSYNQVPLWQGAAFACLGELP